MSFFPRSVLPATDGSEESSLALEAVVDLANKTGPGLHFVHVGIMPDWVYPDTARSEKVDELRREAQKVLDAEVEKIEAAGETVAHAHPTMGRADAEVVRLAEEGTLNASLRGEVSPEEAVSDLQRELDSTVG